MIRIQVRKNIEGKNYLLKKREMEKKEYLWVAKIEFDRIGGGLGFIYIYVNVR